LCPRRIATTISRTVPCPPRQANDPRVAAKILAQFLKNHEDTIRQAIASNDLATARRAVNGGDHGLAEFIDSFNSARQILGQSRI
jgi:predicted chitinase